MSSSVDLLVSPAPGRPGLLAFLLHELRPKGKLLTPFNVVTSLLMAAAAAILVVRFARGLGSVTNLSQDYPWGLWTAFDVITGVAFAGGAYVLTFLVYVLRLETYRPIVRATVLNGFLAYVFYAGALLIELGRPWHIVNPIIGRSFGVSSVLFLVAWHFLLYMMAQLLEFSPTITEWLGLERARRLLSAATLGAVVFGITLSTLHQSGLGALFLMAKPKIHPLWYSEFIPLLFFVSSIFAGVAMVIVEGSISWRVFAHRVGPALARTHDSILQGLGRIAAGALFVYLALLALAFLHGRDWLHLGDPLAAWYAVEVGGFVVLPLLVFLRALRSGSRGLLRLGAGLTLAGVVLNRLNVAIIAYNWLAPVRYVPTWMEVVVSLAVIAAEIWVFRWVVNRMPVLGETGATRDAVRMGGRAPAAC